MSRQVRQRLFIAGQIALRPSDLAMPDPPSFAMEAALSAQHVRRIVKAMQENASDGSIRGWMESCICWLSGPADTFKKKLAAARSAWRAWQPEQQVPLLIVHVPQLPREAQIEWQVTWHNGQRAAALGQDEDEDETPLLPEFGKDSATQDGDTMSLRSGTDACVIAVDCDMPQPFGQPISRRNFSANEGTGTNYGHICMPAI